MVAKFQIRWYLPLPQRRSPNEINGKDWSSSPRQRGAVGSRSRVIAGNTLKGDVHLPERLLLLASKPLVKVCRHDVPTR